MNRSPLLLLAALAALLTACGDSPASSDAGVDAAVSLSPSCQEIIHHCHEVDPGTGPIHDCHELGHDTTSTEAQCAAQLSTCTMLCEAVDAGAGVIEDAGVTDDAPHMH